MDGIAVKEKRKMSQQELCQKFKIASEENLKIYLTGRDINLCLLQEVYGFGHHLCGAIILVL